MRLLKALLLEEYSDAFATLPFCPYKVKHAAFREFFAIPTFPGRHAVMDVGARADE